MQDPNTVVLSIRLDSDDCHTLGFRLDKLTADEAIEELMLALFGSGLSHLHEHGVVKTSYKRWRSEE